MTSGYRFRQMDDADARKISAWRYEPPYDFYDVAKDPEDLEELLDAKKRQDYFAAFSGDGDELVGFLCFGAEAQVPGGPYGDGDELDVGLGLRPDLTGKGLGLPFLLSGLEFARRGFSPAGFRLSVATFNERAMRVYERAGFRRGDVFTRFGTGGVEQPFLVMRREA